MHIKADFTCCCLAETLGSDHYIIELQNLNLLCMTQQLGMALIKDWMKYREGTPDNLIRNPEMWTKEQLGLKKHT